MSSVSEFGWFQSAPHGAIFGHYGLQTLGFSVAQ